eukprot:761850-Hanusia_phi.AAC.2
MRGSGACVEGAGEGRTREAVEFGARVLVRRRRRKHRICTQKSADVCEQRGGRKQGEMRG